ncbi:helix-turn-helix transcriptional regulator [Brevibacillus laterosporus]|uniref:Transcriptional regulator n=1 Tax=Brevibacillus laterosporus TaxID=1465 RepID=A0AAP8Q8C4_BRELA|nr:helix-turn-helix domain-containing protein [Brevibacillus laterosporus]ATO47826.1 transcriptional regulator [Brevibacillus laterosporus DSM 25]AYB37405.1 helix-turn-helix domain-containing protein [Brevibacillus laterosporus]MBG9773525.1 DNA-binding protein [Brevibacillus laterosporus]MBG9796557.1 DNA-binding protein [Brevibacillus laterosporus]MBG9804972.1 DNA-binding protein [Brevibacillus laterosporus]
MICYLKAILVMLDMSQQELADTLGVSRNTITSLARNKSVPNLMLAYDIVDALNDRAAEQGLQKLWTVEQIWDRKKSQLDMQNQS